MMELAEAPRCPFQFGPAYESRKQLVIQPKLRVAGLTERFDVRAVLQAAVVSEYAFLKEFSSLESIEQAIEEKHCDVAVIDIERIDYWPSVVFDRFDEVASFFPIIILCKSKRDMLNYRLKANHVSDIFSYETVRDPRFFSVIEALRLRIETAQSAEDGGTSDHSHWQPPTAA